MNPNLFREQMGSSDLLGGVPVSPGAFMVCPAALQAACGQRPWGLSVYQMAFQQAQAALQPVSRQRDLFAVWN
jgi:hypothetical protein